jgi:hypothetical protein
MPRTSTLHNTDYRTARPSDGREHVVFESIVALLALIMIISGFLLYVGNAFAATAHTQANTIPIETVAPVTDKPLSLAEI